MADGNWSTWFMLWPTQGSKFPPNNVTLKTLHTHKTDFRCKWILKCSDILILNTELEYFLTNFDANTFRHIVRFPHEFSTADTTIA